MEVLLDCTDLTDTALLLDREIPFRSTEVVKVDLRPGMHSVAIPNIEGPPPELLFELRTGGDGPTVNGEGIALLADPTPRIVIAGTDITIDAGILTVQEVAVNGIQGQTPSQEYHVRLLPASNHRLWHHYSVCYGQGHPSMLFGVRSDPVAGAQVYFEDRYAAIATGRGTNRLTLTGAKVLVDARSFLGQAPQDKVLIRSTVSPDGSEFWSVSSPFMLGLLPGIHGIEVMEGGMLPFAIADTGAIQYASIGAQHSNEGNARLSVMSTMTIL